MDQLIVIVVLGFLLTSLVQLILFRILVKAIFDISLREVDYYTEILEISRDNINKTNEIFYQSIIEEMRGNK